MSTIQRRLTGAIADLSCQLVGKRFAGGGGRPGGKPGEKCCFYNCASSELNSSVISFIAFNWREKMILRLNAKNAKKPVPVQPYGDFNYLQKNMDAERGDFMITLKGKDQTKLSPEDVTRILEGDNNSRKVVNVAALFGSHKSAGMLPHKHNKKQNFSHRRVFGSK